MARIAVRQPPSPEATPVALDAFRVSYEAANDSYDRTEGHWDYVAIYDGDDRPCYENWLPQDALEPGHAYRGSFDVPGLAAGDYRVYLTVDGGGDAPVAEEYPLVVPAAIAS